jgi:hypothetical protein
LLCAFDVGGFGLSKMPSFAGNGEEIAPTWCFRRHGPGWRKTKKAWQHIKGKCAKTREELLRKKRDYSVQYGKFELRLSAFKP